MDYVLSDLHLYLNSSPRITTNKVVIAIDKYYNNLKLKQPTLVVTPRLCTFSEVAKLVLLIYKYAPASSYCDLALFLTRLNLYYKTNRPFNKKDISYILINYFSIYRKV